MIESVTYVTLKTNVKTSRMGSSKWNYHKECSFASVCFIFWKFCFSIRTCYKELIWSTNYPRDNTGIKFGRRFPHEHHLMMGTLQLRGLRGKGAWRPCYCFPYFLPHENCSCWVWKLGSDACPLNLVCLQYFFPNAEQLIGEESRAIALH